MRRRRATALIILSLVLLYLFAFPGRRVVMPNTPYTLVVQPGVSQTSVDLIRDGLTLADEFLVSQEVTTLIEPAEVRVARFSPCSPLKPLPQLGATAQVVGSRLCINTVDGVWQQALNGNSGIAFSVVAHEHYHLLQHQLGCLPPPWNKHYDWFIEGSASYVGWETAVSGGKLEREWVDNLLVQMREESDLEPFQSYEKGIGGDGSYSLAYQAIQQLVAKTGSLESLNNFCVRVGQGEPWREAFADVFGIALEDFYATFEGASPEPNE